jgi:hypothetical protein
MATLKDIKSKKKEELDEYINTDQLEKLEQELNQPEGIKLTETEIRLLTDLNRKKDLVSREVNFLAQQRLNIDYRQEEAEKLYRSNLELERQLGNQFTEKYGNGTIDIEKGLFIPS